MSKRIGWICHRCKKNVNCVSVIEADDDPARVVCYLCLRYRERPTDRWH